MAEEIIEQVATPEVAQETKSETKSHQKGRPQGKRAPRRGDRRNQTPEFQETVVTVRRVSKTVKGGRNMRFTALVVVGNGKGTVGFGTGKAKEVPDAIKKALEAAKKNLYKVPMVKGGTFPHEIMGEYGAAKVFMKPAPAGAGIIAGGPVRAVLELAGIKNVYSKVSGSRTPINVVRATINGIENMKTVSKVAALRGKDPKEILA